MKALLLVIALMAVPAWAVEQAGSVKDKCQTALREIDSAVQFSADGSYCVGFVTGWGQGIDETFFVGDDQKVWRFALDDGVTIEQMIRVFVKYVNEHPEQMNKTADTALTLAATTAELGHKYDTGLRASRPEEKKMNLPHESIAPASAAKWKLKREEKKPKA